MGRNFADDGLHAFLTGSLEGLVRREIANAHAQGRLPIPNMASVHVEADADGDYKPILTIEMESGRKFRVIIAEIT